MPLLHALILGLVQGVTEFLPISSTAHLKIVPSLLGWRDPGAAFSAVIQCGTGVAVLWYFRAEVWHMVRALLTDIRTGKFCHTMDARLAWMIILGTLPAVGFGLLFKKQIEGELRSLYVISASMIILALVLMYAERLVRRRQKAGLEQHELTDLSWWDAVLVGLAQALALIPGSSRSGVTITAGLFRSMTRETAARFSFLLSLTVVPAAGLYELYKERHELLSSQENTINLLAATLIASVVGYMSIAFLLRYLKTHTTYLFIVYRIALGCLLLLLLQQGLLRAF